MELDAEIEIGTGSGAPDPIKVSLGHNVATENVAPEYTGWNTYQVYGTAGEGPIQIAPQNRRRNKCDIRIIPGANNNSNGVVILGTLAQVSARQGMIMLNGMTLSHEGSGAVYAIGDGLGVGDQLQISVHDELYRREREQ